MAEAKRNIIHPPTEEHLPPGCKNCLVISFDLETTGLSSDDEIIQIGAYTYNPANHRTSFFNQFILPSTRTVHPDAASLIGLEVRMGTLHDSRTNTIVPTVSEMEGLLRFLNWLTSLQHGYSGVVLVSHGAIFLDIPVLIRALQRASLAENFFQVVKGFCDSNAIFQEDKSTRYRSLSLQHLYQTIVGERGAVHRALEDARDLYILLLRHFKVESLSLAIPMLDLCTYTSQCMVLYSNWRKQVDGKMDGLRVIVKNWKEQSEKKKTVVLRNLVAAGYDIQTLTDDYRRSPSDVVFKNQLRGRIQAMKDNYENYLLDTSYVRAYEVVRAVLCFMRDRQMP